MDMGVTPPGPVEGDTAPRPSPEEGDTAPRPSPDPVSGQPEVPADSDPVTVAQINSTIGRFNQQFELKV